MKANSLYWDVLLTDGTEVEVRIPDIEYQSEDHITEAIWEATAKRGFDADEVDDHWPVTPS